MTIRNYMNTQESKQLYEVKYDGTLVNTEKDARVYILATGLEDAIEMFCGFYKTRVPNPNEIPEANELTDPDRQDGKRAIKGIEKITSAVLDRIDTRKPAFSR